jgi:restriction endonuclease S subunit
MLCLTMGHRPPSHLIQSIVQILFFFSSQISILNSERKEKKRSTVLRCTRQQFHLWSEEIRELIVRKNTDLNKKGRETEKKRTE